ncbi:MAG: hypothetical protein ACREXR_01485, partial [Gammaproteobacteria bacterium]
MPNYTYLIVGGGMTTDAAVHGIREVDPNGSIGLVSTETHPPYNRPPLSKGLWKGKPGHGEENYHPRSRGPLMRDRRTNTTPVAVPGRWR